MALSQINIGTTANDGTGDTLRAAFVKVNANLTELYGVSAAYAKYRPQAYYGSDRSSTSYAAVAADILYATPVIIVEPVTIDALALRINSGIAATTMLAGIYSDSGGLPNALLYQLTSPLSTASFASPLQGSFSSNPTLQPGRYWLASLFSGAPSPLCVATADNTNSNVIGSTTFGDVGTQSVGITGVSVARTYGLGLPATFGGATVRSNVITPLVFFKAA